MQCRRSPRRSAAPVALFVALFAIGQLLGFAHAASVRHVECATHGELVEAIDAGATSVWTCDARLVASGGDELAAEHEHCAVTSALRHAATTSSHATLAVTAPPVVALAVTSQPAIPSLRAPRYRLAPKTSPPLAG